MSMYKSYIFQPRSSEFCLIEVLISEQVQVHLVLAMIFNEWLWLVRLLKFLLDFFVPGFGMLKAFPLVCIKSVQRLWPGFSKTPEKRLN